MFGCYKHHKKVGGDRIVNLEMDGDSEQGTLHSSEPPKFIEAPAFRKEFPCNGQDRELAGFWGYVFQVIFQVTCQNCKQIISNSIARFLLLNSESIYLKLASDNFFSLANR